MAGIPFDVALDMWRALRQWHVTYTEYMKQPPEYWEAMFRLDALYNHKWLRNKPADKPQK